VRISDVAERLAFEFASSPEERSHLLPSGTKTPFSNRVHWGIEPFGHGWTGGADQAGTFPQSPVKGREVLATSPERIDIR
jgi:restriction system protein